MKTKNLIKPAIALFILMIAFTACKKDENTTPTPTPTPTGDLPTVVTKDVYCSSINSALCQGTVMEDGGSTVTEIGFCWSTSQNPTIDDSHVAIDTEIYPFSGDLTGLTANTKYYVKAYATNGAGTGYGEELSFTTLIPAQTGALSGAFTAGDNKHIYFAQGNLQYQASTNTWRFADTQFDIIGSENSHLSPTYDGWIDLFCWATSGYPHGSTHYQPWSTYASYGNNAYNAYGAYTYNLYDSTGMADWAYNPISNGGNQENIWHTPTVDEWTYVCQQRETPSGILFVMAQVGGRNGMILFPDTWDADLYELNYINLNNYPGFDVNVISASDWAEIFEANGAVFLAAAGAREDHTISAVGTFGGYWSSSRNVPVSSYGVSFNDHLMIDFNSLIRWGGYSVRLACDAD